MEERRRDRASKRDERPAPEMRIGFRVLAAIVMAVKIDQIGIRADGERE